MSNRRVRILQGESGRLLKNLPSNSIDALITDPPAGINYMGLAFDSDRGGRDQWVSWLTRIFRECVRVIKPGAHALVWALPRTSHWTAMALEDSGLEIRDAVHHLFSTGMPKGISIDKAIDRCVGATRKVVGRQKNGRRSKSSLWSKRTGFGAEYNITIPRSPQAKKWRDWHSAMKPAHEIWWLCRKPLSEPSIAANIMEWGTGAINAGATRVGDEGRFPTNFILTHSSACTSRKCSAICPVGSLESHGRRRKVGDTKARVGNVSRFFPAFYGPKATPTDRGSRNDHPTAKNTDLMRWLCRLVTPTGGTVLDPFMGSGSTGVACLRERFNFVGIEQERLYVGIAKRRIKTAAKELGLSLKV